MTSDTHLSALLRGAAWLPEDGRRADRHEVADEAALGDGLRLLLTTAVGGPAHGRRFLVPVRTDAAGRTAEAPGTEEFDRACVRLAAAGATLPTARGGHVAFRGSGPAPRTVRVLPFERGWSSNSLSRVDLDGRPHLHKTYRAPDPGIREPELLRLMDGGGHTPGWFGDYAYVPPGGGPPLPLGVVYAYAPGTGIDAPLRANLRALWPKTAAPDPAGPPGEAVRAHLAPLAGTLTAARDFLGSFHRELRLRLGGDAPLPAYPAGRALDAAEARIAALAERARDEAVLPRPVLDAAFRALAGEAALLRDSLAAGPWHAPAGPCHGDLHLSHLLTAPPRVIDVSTPATGPGEPGWDEQSPLEDLVALGRALEYFSADEAADHAARLLGTDSARTMLAALDGGAALPPAEQAPLLRVFAAADAWRQHVAELLIGPAGAASGHGGEELRRLLRLRRLLHELDYNFAHARPYHAAIDLRHALALGHPSPSARTLTTRT
ncbi:hypothetical protein [Streptomyces termitum]|uniref:hypothetical protein n=1 Tax=Streptomyces termitum TaxID=67368 RepID=UPI0033AC3060